VGPLQSECAGVQQLRGFGWITPPEGKEVQALKISTARGPFPFTKDWGSLFGGESSGEERRVPLEKTRLWEVNVVDLEGIGTGLCRLRGTKGARRCQEGKNKDGRLLGH